MKAYLDIVKKVLDSGIYKANRTDIPTIMLPFQHFQHNMQDGFPLLTTKRMPLKVIAVELEGFLKGITSKKWYQDNGCHIWDEWANPLAVQNYITQYPLLKTPIKEIQKEYDDLGPIYPHQFRHFGACYDEDDDGPINGTDQITNIINILKTDPDSRRMVCSAWNPNQMSRMALPPCFVKGSVYTSNGYKEIQNIVEGDLVYSHDDSFNVVNKVWKTEYDGEIIHITPYYTSEAIECTPNHQFLTRDRGWQQAKDLVVQDYVAAPQNKKSIIISVSEKNVPLTQQNMYTLGYLAAVGYIKKNTDTVCFTLRKNYKIVIKKAFQGIELRRKIVSNRKVYYFTYNKKWTPIVQQFGNNSTDKCIPQWVFDSPKEYIRSFLDGFLDAKTVVTKYGVTCSITSPQLALGLQKLCYKAGYKVTINKFSRTAGKDTFNIRFVKKIIRPNDGQFTDQNFIWTAIKHITQSHQRCNVYNIEVNNTNTYIIDNVVTHNCHVLWNLVHVNGVLNLHWHSRSADLLLGVPFNIASYALLLLLLCKEANLQPGILSATFADCHIYKNHIDGAKMQILRDPYPLPQVEIPNENWINILNWSHHYLTLKNYKHHSHIPFEVAI